MCIFILFDDLSITNNSFPVFKCVLFNGCVIFQVYLPCVLQTKKRYVGFMYETPDQEEPVFDAKGIETVRRDSCPAVSKVTWADS